VGLRIFSIGGLERGCDCCDIEVTFAQLHNCTTAQLHNCTTAQLHYGISAPSIESKPGLQTM